ncbi:MAG: hypothetical protein WD894_04160 [Pirellulales bacterium]
MMIFADYEGLGVAIAQGFWLLLTVPAALLAIGGIVSGALRRPRRRLAFWLGASACVVEGAGIALVSLALAEALAFHPSHAESFRPGPIFWTVCGLTMAGGMLAVCLGLFRKTEPNIGRSRD